MPKLPKTLEFAPGCFDTFDGTQEELDELIAEITRLFESGELEDHAEPVNENDLLPDELAALSGFLENPNRTLQ